jgi:PncC family amidohydrolase
MLKELLEKYNFKLAVAESLTGGKLSAKICNESGISKYYLGSVTSYTCDIKNRVLGVAKELLDEQGPYNFDTTHQMCDGVMSLMNSDVAVATSGVAGPGPDLGVEQGTYYITVKVKRKYFDKEFKSTCKTRGGVRAEAMTNAYRYLIEILSNYEKY